MEFSAKSRERLEEVTSNLKAVAEKAIGYNIIDFSIIEGARSKAEQNRYYSLGKSKVQWPDSKHNIEHPDDKAEAFDATPFVNSKISWDHIHCCVLAGTMLAAAAELGIRIRWGGNWDMDGEPVTDQDFQDLVHFEEI